MVWRTRITTILGFGVCLCLYGNICLADACADSMQAQTYSCVFKSCSAKITVTTPGEDRGNLVLTCEPVACCQQLFTDCLFTGDTCSQLRDPEVTKRVVEAAATSRVLVADCEGRYALFEAAPDHQDGRNSALIDEHVLR